MFRGERYRCCLAAVDPVSQKVFVYHVDANRLVALRLERMYGAYVWASCSLIDSR